MRINIILTTLLIALLSACGGRQQGSDQQQENGNATKIESTQPRSQTASAHPGKKVYDSTCLMCHMADGSGVPRMYPPLTGTDWVNGDKERLIRITIQGLSGKIEVKGETYNNIMPPNAHLSDKEIADVLTYVRQNFGNDASEITVEEVREVRNNL